MKWVRFGVVTVIVWLLGFMASIMNAMMECFPHMPDFQQCLSDKRRDALIIIIVTIIVWAGLSFLIFRKKRTS